MIKYYCDVCGESIAATERPGPYVFPTLRKKVEYDAWGEVHKTYLPEREECYLCLDCAANISRKIWRN